MRVGGLRVRELRSDGAGPPVVFIHGLGVSTLYFRPALERFARDGAVLALDLPGFGRSDDPPRPFGVVELARFCSEWLDAAGVVGAPLLGNSMGCQVAVELAAARPDLASALVVVGPTTDADAGSRAALVPRLVLDSLREPLALTAVVAYDYLVRAGPLTTIRTARAMVEHRIEDRAPAVAAPVLVVRGEHDPIAPRAWCRALAARFPRGAFAEIPGAAHAAHFSHPASLVALARPLFRGEPVVSGPPTE